MSINLRDGRKEDLPQALQLIKELAEFERAPEEVDVTLEELERDSFGEKPIFKFFVAEDTEQNKIVGLALYFYSYSTWKGKCIYLEDLIVTEAYRGQGIGKQLLERVIQKAKEEDARRVVWQVLDWNTPAIEFYKSIGASVLSEWLTCRLVKDQIQKYN